MESVCAGKMGRFFRRISMPAVVAGHRNAALDEELAQGEANFSRANKANFHVRSPYLFSVWGDGSWFQYALEGCRYCFLFGIRSAGQL